MQDKLIISRDFKKTILYIEKAVINYPHTELVLKQKIINTNYDVLECIYRANVYKDAFYMKEILVKIRMLEYYIKLSLDKKLISFKKYENIGKYLLETVKMINVWIKNETVKQPV